MLNIIAIETDIGFFIREKELSNSYSNTGLKRYLFDDTEATETFSPKWLFIKNKPTFISEKKSATYINHRFELKDHTFANKPTSLPLVLTIDNGGAIKDSEYGWRVVDKYENYQSLYEYKNDIFTPEPTPIEFNFEITHRIDKIENVQTPDKFGYKVFRSRWQHEGTRVLTAPEIRHPAIDEILYPDILLPTRPSYLTSKQSYDIIRLFVKENINNKVAEITSDYDFCFTVKKKIELCEVEEYMVNVAISKRKPRYEKRFKRDRSVEIFEMTHSESNYKGYTVIPGFQGVDQEDLKKNIDTFLSKLIEKINQPLKECSHCKGYGVIFE